MLKNGTRKNGTRENVIRKCLWYPPLPYPFYFSEDPIKLDKHRMRSNLVFKFLVKSPTHKTSHKFTSKTGNDMWLGLGPV